MCNPHLNNVGVCRHRASRLRAGRCAHAPDPVTLLANLKFLIVEDHDVQRKLMARLLTNLGAEIVHCATDGESALAVVRNPATPVDVVVTDLSMPGMDGVGFARHLSGVDAHPSLIISTSLAPGPLAAIVRITQNYRINLLGAVNKPLTPEKLAPLIEIHHARSKGRAADDEPC